MWILISFHLGSIRVLVTWLHTVTSPVRLDATHSDELIHFVLDKTWQTSAASQTAVIECSSSPLSAKTWEASTLSCNTFPIPLNTFKKQHINLFSNFFSYIWKTSLNNPKPVCCKLAPLKQICSRLYIDSVKYSHKVNMTSEGKCRKNRKKSDRELLWRWLLCSAGINILCIRA